MQKIINPSWFPVLLCKINVFFINKVYLMFKSMKDTFLVIFFFLFLLENLQWMTDLLKNILGYSKHLDKKEKDLKYFIYTMEYIRLINSFS